MEYEPKQFQIKPTVISQPYKALIINPKSINKNSLKKTISQILLNNSLKLYNLKLQDLY